MRRLTPSQTGVTVVRDCHLDACKLRYQYDPYNGHIVNEALNVDPDTIQSHYVVKTIQNKIDLINRSDPSTQRLIVISNVIINNVTLGAISVYNGDMKTLDSTFNRGHSLILNLPNSEGGQVNFQNMFFTDIDTDSKGIFYVSGFLNEKDSTNNYSFVVRVNPAGYYNYTDYNWVAASKLRALTYPINDNWGDNIYHKSWAIWRPRSESVSGGNYQQNKRWLESQYTGENLEAIQQHNYHNGKINTFAHKVKCEELYGNENIIIVGKAVLDADNYPCHDESFSSRSYKVEGLFVFALNVVNNQDIITPSIFSIQNWRTDDNAHLTEGTLFAESTLEDSKINTTRIFSNLYDDSTINITRINYYTTIISYTSKEVEKTPEQLLVGDGNLRTDMMQLQFNWNQSSVNDNSPMVHRVIGKNTLWGILDIPHYNHAEATAMCYDPETYSIHIAFTCKNKSNKYCGIVVKIPAMTLRTVGDDNLLHIETLLYEDNGVTEFHYSISNKDIEGKVNDIIVDNNHIYLGGHSFEISGKTSTFFSKIYKNTKLVATGYPIVRDNEYTIEHNNDTRIYKNKSTIKSLISKIYRTPGTNNSFTDSETICAIGSIRKHDNNLFSQNFRPLVDLYVKDYVSDLRLNFECVIHTLDANIHPLSSKYDPSKPLYNLGVPVNWGLGTDYGTSYGTEGTLDRAKNEGVGTIAYGGFGIPIPFINSGSTNTIVFSDISKNIIDSSYNVMPPTSKLFPIDLQEMTNLFNTFDIDNSGLIEKSEAESMAELFLANHDDIAQNIPTVNIAQHLTAQITIKGYAKYNILHTNDGFYASTSFHLKYSSLDAPKSINYTTLNMSSSYPQLSITRNNRASISWGDREIGISKWGNVPLSRFQGFKNGDTEILHGLFYRSKILEMNTDSSKPTIFKNTSFNSAFARDNDSKITDTDIYKTNPWKLIENIDTKNIINMDWTFANYKQEDYANIQSPFQKIINWNVENVQSMKGMLKNTEINSDIRSWNVSNVTNMSEMFQQTNKFNQNISNWNISNVVNMSKMFKQATAFNKDIRYWAPIIRNDAIFDEFLFMATAHITKYSDIHENYPTNGTPDISYWTDAELPEIIDDDDESIISEQPIDDNTQQEQPVDDNTQDEQPVDDNTQQEQNGYNNTQQEQTVSNTTQQDSTFKNDNYVSYQNYTVANIVGPNVTVKYLFTVNPDTNNSEYGLFTDAIADWFNNSYTSSSHGNTYGNIEDWDVGNVTDMTEAFKDRTTFNEDIGRWNVSSLKIAKEMFRDARAFNQYLGNWDTRAVTNMEGMFRIAVAFNNGDTGDNSNKPLKWNTSNVTTFHYMFGGWNVNGERTQFNQDIGTWDVSKASEKAGMFNNNSKFNKLTIRRWNSDGDIGGNNYFFKNATAYPSSWNTGEIFYRPINSFFRQYPLSYFKVPDT